MTEEKLAEDYVQSLMEKDMEESLEESKIRQIKGALLKCAEENKNKSTPTFHQNISALCTDAELRIRELEKQIPVWHEPAETPEMGKDLLLYVETKCGRGLVVGYYDEGECLEDYEKTFGHTDFIDFVQYDFVPGEVRVLAWQYVQPPKMD